MRDLAVLFAALACAALGLAACGASDDDPLPVSPPPEAGAPAPAETLESRAGAAGLSRRQAAALAALGVPVYVPEMPAGWTLLAASADSLADGAFVWPAYALRYQTDQQTCLSLVGASDGLGDVMLDDPPYERTVRVPGVPMAALARLGWSVPGERTEGWADGRVASEWFGTDLISVRVEAAPGEGGCLPASPEAAESLLTSLRPLDPADDAATIGLVSFTEAAGTPGADPEAVALDAFGAADLDAPRQGTTVETLMRRPRVAVVLVTTVDEADESVRDARTRVVLVRGSGGWAVHSAGRQVRCQTGHGHAEWSAEFCT